ncbi:MAG: hypothetical protein RSD36_12460 [Terrisporobacter sp.]
MPWLSLQTTPLLKSEALDNELLEIQKDIFSKEGGIKEGEKKKAIEIAKSLLDVDTIALKIGLSIDEINKLK